jgi:hypothetical protein
MHRHRGIDDDRSIQAFNEGTLKQVGSKRQAEGYSI